MQIQSINLYNDKKQQPNFTAIKNIKYKGLYEKTPELADTILAIFQSKSYENTREFCKMNDVDVILNLDDKLRHTIEFKIYPKNYENLSFFKSLFSRKKKVKIEAFEQMFSASFPLLKELAVGAEKVNKELARFIPDVKEIEASAVQPNKTVLAMTEAQKPVVKQDSAKMENILKYNDGTIKKNEFNCTHNINEKQRELANYKGGLADYSCYEYYPDGNIKEYTIIGKEQECYGQFYENGKRKNDLILDKEQHSDGINPYITTKGRLKTYDESGILLEEKSSDMNCDYYTPDYLLYKCNGRTYLNDSRISQKDKDISRQRLNIFLTSPDFRRNLYPEMTFIDDYKIVTLNDRTWLFPDNSIFLDQNGYCAKIKPNEIISYDHEFNEYSRMDVVNGERILRN